MQNHDGIAMRWVDRCLGSTAPAHKGRNLHDVGDSILSYGSHFEVGRVLRDKRGEARGFLLNGNTFSVTTSRHQGAVRSAVARSGLPVITLPHDALEAASIDISTVEAIDVQSDWWTSTIQVRTEEPRRAYDYNEAADGDFGGWINSKTGEFFGRLAYWGDGSRPPKVQCEHVIEAPGPWKPGYNYERDYVERKMREQHDRFAHGEWEEISAHRRNTGRVKWVSGLNDGIEWEAVDIDGTIEWHRETRRHWLGASLLRAQVIYRVNQRCTQCAGTGQGEKWFTLDHRTRGIGPLERDGAERNDGHHEFMLERWRRDVKLNETAVIQRDQGPEPLQQWAVDIGIEHTECRGCSGRGRVMSDTKRRWAYFLSGFDLNETRPSYYFCELPPKARPTTVDEALEELKPQAVRIAEQAGRDVKRQGDIFAIPMPRLDLRTMKKFGGVHIKRPKLVQAPRFNVNGIDERDDAGRPLVWSGPRPTLLGTNHEATEVVIYEGQTYGRGTITHNPAGRRPDHKRLPLGKEWHLILKNTVPIGA
jgi:hypothetical protein